MQLIDAYTLTANNVQLTAIEEQTKNVMYVEEVDAAQVVRCEDCNKSNEWVNGRWCRRFCTLVNTDSYCSFGEKRKERLKE